MFRLLMLRNKLALQRSLVTRLTARSNVATSLLYRSAHRSRFIDGVMVVDVNLDEMVKGDAEFARSFANSLSSDRCLFQPAVESVGMIENQSPPLEDTIPADGSLPTGAPSSVLDNDGNTIKTIEIDGWTMDDEEDDAEQPNNQDVKAENVSNDEVDKK